jgi:hypothetical protein
MGSLRYRECSLGMDSKFRINLNKHKQKLHPNSLVTGLPDRHDIKTEFRADFSITLEVIVRCQ